MQTEIANQVMALAVLFSDGLTSSLEKRTEMPTNSTIQTSKRLQSVQFWLGVAAVSLIPDPKWLELSEAWRQLKVFFNLLIN